MIRALGPLLVLLITFGQSTVYAQTAYQKYPSIAEAPYSALDAFAHQQETIKQTIRKAAEYQLKKYGDKIPTKDWLVGTFFSSFVAAYHVTGDDWYLSKAYDWGEQSDWDINKAIHADDVCPGQTYLDLYFIKKDPEMYQKLHQKLAPYFDRTEILPGEKSAHQKEPLPLNGRNTWSWCDALYMAPPVYARMRKATGDPRYYEMLHRLYWDAVDFLYAEDEKLFHRNSKAQTESERTPGGKKVYWGRGNGWVFGGLTRLIEYLPEDDSMKPNYLQLFQDLAYSLARYQMEDGLWRSSVNEPEWISTKETSGSSFYVYGIAKGINEGWLPKEYFTPVVLKGWSGLMSCLTPEGKLGYSQIVGGSPHEVRPHDSKDYAVGAFILAATEMLRFKPGNELNRISNGAFVPRVVARDGAWTWYNDERVIFHNKVFFANYVKRNGKAAFTAFSIEKWASAHARKEKMLSTWEQADDHNNGALLPLKDGNILACYAMHGGKSKSFYQRKITVPRWKECKPGEEQVFKTVTTQRGLTYQNLHRLSDENDRIYNFFRGNNFNPHFVYSEDEAETWSSPIWLIYSGENSSHRPYAKYVSNGKDRIDFLYTDGHPRSVKENNVYHFYYHKGTFYTSSGKKIRTMDELKNKPIKPK
ncbi:MAG: glycoside hydrolase family 88 protein [Bacteroidota bacterium]